MNKVLPWIKSNTAIVVLSALILIILPAAFVGSSMWNSRIRKGRDKAVTEKNSQLDALKVTYSMPPSVPGGQAVSFPWAAPNKVATDYFRDNRKVIEEQIKRITVEAEAINKQGHAPLMDGVFPAPADKTKTLDFTEMLVGKGDKPSVYQQLLDKIKAGGPADPIKVREVLVEADQQAIAKMKATSNSDKFSPEEQKAHDDTLSKIRIGQYKFHANDISVYATKDCLPAGIPKAVPPQPPEVTLCWSWQEDYWVVYDLLTGVDEANRMDGKRTSVDKSVVKRIEQIFLYPPDASLDTVTGRKNSTANKSYDVRSARLIVVVSSSRLPQLVNALSRTDFTTVTGLDIADVDRQKDLNAGYYYGEEHVVLATLTVETVWLRNWTTSIMPEEEKKRRETSAEEVAAAAAPPSGPCGQPPGLASG